MRRERAKSMEVKVLQADEPAQKEVSISKSIEVKELQAGTCTEAG